MIDDSLNNAVKNDVSYRSGLPIGYQHFGGLCESEKSQPFSDQRQLFENQVNNLIKNLKKYKNLDHSIDKFSLKNFYTNSLPPSISDGEHVTNL